MNRFWAAGGTRVASNRMTGIKDGQFPATGGMEAPTRGRLVRVVVGWGPAVAWMGFIFLLSAQPGLRVSDDPGVDGPIRHFAHVVTYGVLACLLLRSLRAGSALRWTRRTVLLAIALATLYGVSDEIHQTYVPARTGHLVDVGWDLLGAALGLVLLRLAPWRWLRRSSVVAGPD